VAGQGNREINEEPAGARADQQSTENNEEDDIGRTYVQGYAEDSIARHKERIDEFFKANRRAVEEAREMVCV
jgi:hypothetical protein